jgi:phosphatidylinositol alpha-mannosyltransferase
MPGAEPLRIGIVAPYDLGRPGGVNTHIRGLAQALRGRGHRVSVCGAASRPAPAGEYVLGSTLTFVLFGTETGLGLDPRAIGAVRRLFDRESFDVLHVHDPFNPLVPWIAVLAAKCPVVATFHTHREGGHALYPWIARALAPVARRLDARIAVSACARRTVAEHFPGQYHIVPNGIDLDRYGDVPARPAEMAGDGLYVLFVGRLEGRKGADHLIRAMGRVQHAVPNARLVVVGDGPDRAPLTELARGVGIDVTFTGRVEDERLPAYYHAADIVCSPATGGESFGLVLVEAMACGKPVVASAIEGYVELIGDSQCAHLVPPGDVDALAAGLTRLLADPESRATMGRRAAAAVRRFGWDHVAPSIEAIYRSAIQPAATADSTASGRASARR